MKEMIETAFAPSAIGPYSQAIRAGQTMYVSGQLGVDPKTGVMADDVESQAVQAFENMGAILKEAGASYENVVKTTVFLTDMNDFAAVNAVYARYFKAPFPARSCVAVAALPKGAKVEAEAIVCL